MILFILYNSGEYIQVCHEYLNTYFSNQLNNFMNFVYKHRIDKDKTKQTT